MRRVLLIVAGLALVGVIAVLLGPSGGGTCESTYRVVENLDDFFSPSIIRVEVGTEVDWENTGRNPHTVTADDGSFDSGVLENGDEFEHTFDTPGVFPFTCILHGRPAASG